MALRVAGRQGLRLPHSSSARQCLSSVPQQGSSEKNKPIIDFSDAKAVFATKTTAEVLRAFVVMRMCQIPALVTNGDKLLSLGEKVLGQAIINSILRATFFGHFCAGEDQETIRPTVDSLKKAKVLSILDYAAEADESAKPMDAPTVKSEEWASDAPAASGSQGTVMHEVFPAPQAVARTYHYAGEESCDKHVEVFEKCIEAVHNVTPAGFAAIKLTALGPPALLKRLSSAIVELKALFDKFDVNGDGTLTEEEFARGYNRFFKVDPATTPAPGAPDMSLEGLLSRLKRTPEGKIDYLEWSSQFQLEHLSGLVSLCHNTSGPLSLAAPTPDELNAARAMEARLIRLATLADKLGVRLMIDAEQTYFQPAIDSYVYRLQARCNKGAGRYTIFSTYQCYLRDTEERLARDLQRAQRMGYNFGAKLVRGAYLVSERERAARYGYADPTHPNIEATHESYNRCSDLVLGRMQEERVKTKTGPEAGSGVEFMVASHNQASVEYVLGEMERLGLPPQGAGSGVYFGQLLGMSDHLTFLLGANGYRAYKYVPYGPVQEVVPYLLRRAQENAAMLGEGAPAELAMLTSELGRRLNPFAK